jgi:ribosomal protein L11 methyltransferase
MREEYNELVVTLDESLVDLFADFISTIYDDAIEMEEDKVIVRSQEDISEIKQAIEDFAKECSLECKITLDSKVNEDWVASYQKAVTPVEAGKFYIHPSWYEPKEDAINILIEPALAFGSGHHATTFGCMEAVGEYVKTGDRVLDVGCGSGILGLGATKLGASVDLCDTDEIALTSTNENFALNGETYNKAWVGSAKDTNEIYDIVIANIIADVLKFISNELKRSVKEGGLLILSGILDKKEAGVSAVYSDLELVERKLKDEWVTLVYKKV